MKICAEKLFFGFFNCLVLALMINYKKERRAKTVLYIVADEKIF